MGFWNVFSHFFATPVKRRFLLLKFPVVKIKFISAYGMKFPVFKIEFISAYGIRELGRMDSLTAGGLVTALLVMGLLLLHGIVRKPSKRILSLENKHVLITGGSSGIGFALAKEALAHGSFVTVISRNSAKLHRAVQRIIHESECEERRVFSKAADVSNYEAISVAIKESFEWRPIDVIICNAGFTRSAYLDEASIEDLDTTVRTNLSGTLYSLHTVLPLMKRRSKQHPSSIVLMGSLASLNPLYGQVAYTATKHALKGVADTLRLELIPFHISVTLICPGFVETPMLDDVGITDRMYKVMNLVSFYDRSRAGDPRKLAKITMEAAKKGTCTVAYDFEGLWLSTLSRGGDPAESIWRALLELIVFIPFRLSSFLFAILCHIVIKYYNEKASSKQL